VKVASLSLPLASSAVQVTVVAPGANCEPEAGEHDTEGFASTRSLAVGLV
jgi:hypothetical protein